MKKRFGLLFLTFIGCIPAISGCFFIKRSRTSSSTTSEETSVSEKTTSSSEDHSSSSVSSAVSSSSGPAKVTVAAHTLKDSNPPININSAGEMVSEDVWNSFRYGGKSKFNSHYNFTYKAYSGGTLQMQYFTKDGYYISSSAGKLYYERKNGSTFYQYIDVPDGWLREETTLDIQDKFTSIFVNELYVHMFDFSNYEFNPDLYDGSYFYSTTSFGSTIKFQNGYLTYLMYGNGANVFEISSSFETTIDIPKSYYYE